MTILSPRGLIQTMMFTSPAVLPEEPELKAVHFYELRNLSWTYNYCTRRNVMPWGYCSELVCIKVCAVLYSFQKNDTLGLVSYIFTFGGFQTFKNNMLANCNTNHNQKCYSFAILKTIKGKLIRWRRDLSNSVLSHNCELKTFMI